MVIYTEYIQNFDTSTETRKKLYKNAQFKSLLRKLQDTSGQPSMDLDTYLIMPVQRLPRYRLLLEAVLKFVPENTSEHRVLEEARNSVASVIMGINEKKREEENKQVVIGIQKRISGCNVCVVSSSPHLLITRSPSFHLFHPFLSRLMILNPAGHCHTLEKIHQGGSVV